MYIAYDDKGKIVNALDDNVQKNNIYLCPHCNSELQYKKGIKIQSHFAHKKSAACSYTSYKRESREHLQTKKDFYKHFKNKCVDVKLEHIFKTDNGLQIADVYLENKNIAIEYQRSVISSDDIRARTEGYKNAGIKLIWLLDANKFVTELKVYKDIVHIRYAAFVENFLNYQQGCVFFYAYDYEEKTIVFYQMWPNKIKSRHAICKKSVCKLKNIDFPMNFKFYKKDLCYSFSKEDIENYLSVQLKYDKSVKNKLLSTFYNARISLLDIPQQIAINSVKKLLIKTPLLMWQAKFYELYNKGYSYENILTYMLNYIDFIETIYIDKSIRLKIVKEMLDEYYEKY